ncbi:uncharacterized protein DS421_12g376420 [Arachis hypogaea]|nr:uncharacterized protein DS421_12g376420 [Arachis hypogaea]
MLSLKTSGSTHLLFGFSQATWLVLHPIRGRRGLHISVVSGAEENRTVRHPSCNTNGPRSSYQNGRSVLWYAGHAPRKAHFSNGALNINIDHAIRTLIIRVITFSIHSQPQNSILLHSSAASGVHGEKKRKMSKKYKIKDVDRPELHIIHYLSHSDYKLRMLTCDHPVLPDRYNDRVDEHLRVTGFYHASQIGVVQCQKALVNALIERWHPDTHTFHLPIGECIVTLEDVALILGLPTDGLPVTGMTMSSFEALEAECLLQFGVAPRKSGCRGSCIKLTWLRDLKENLELTDEISIQSWGSACLAHLYRALCKASRFNCKEIDGPLTLLLGWTWIRLPYLLPLPREPRSFSLANRWRNWERGDRQYRYLNLAHFRKALDELQEGQFVWVDYAVDRVDPNIIPAEIYMQSVVWSATVPLVLFECIEWHATDRFRRQFGFVQGVPNQERNLDKAHGEVLTGPKNLNWATTPNHSIWVMNWTNRYNYILSELPMPSQHPLDSYMYWYRSKFGDR